MIWHKLRTKAAKSSFEMRSLSTACGQHWSINCCRNVMTYIKRKSMHAATFFVFKTQYDSHVASCVHTRTQQDRCSRHKICERGWATERDLQQLVFAHRKAHSPQRGLDSKVIYFELFIGLHNGKDGRNHLDLVSCRRKMCSPARPLASASTPTIQSPVCRLASHLDLQVCFKSATRLQVPVRRPNRVY